ncbi:hypothetical protein AMECASPLE_023208 [Ameca splendens]|uniref:Uncharacterized protein n=1 Tax=Ameca splendens TaxID=208324 RepID=A0ABV0Z223_9TELE
MRAMDKSYLQIVKNLENLCKMGMFPFVSNQIQEGNHQDFKETPVPKLAALPVSEQPLTKATAVWAEISPNQAQELWN